MNSRTAIILSCYLSAIIFFGIIFTADYALLGCLIGYWTGLINILWLFRDAGKVLDKNLKAALRLYYRSLFTRLGIVTLVVAATARLKPEWLFYLASGIAAGIIIPLLLLILKQYIHMGGGER